MSTAVIIDDRSADIVYTGSWQHSTGRPQEFRSTTSYATDKSAALTYSFQGTSVSVSGTFGVGQATKVAISVDGTTPTLLETTDNPNTSPPTFHNTFFDSGTLADGNHTIAMVIDPSGPASNFFVDYITYVPTLNLPIANQQYFVDDTSPAVNYVNAVALDPKATGAYENFLNTSHYLPKGSSASVTFASSSIQVYGVVPNNNNSGVAVTFQIDGQPPVPAPFPPATLFTGAAFDLGVVANYPWFSSDNLAPGTHTLSIVSQADSIFYLDYLIVPSNNTSILGVFQPSNASPSVTPSSTSSISSTATSSTRMMTTTQSRPTNSLTSSSPIVSATSEASSESSASQTIGTGAIIGAVVGALFALALLAAAYLWLGRYLRRRRVRANFNPRNSFQHSSSGYVQPDPAWSASNDLVSAGHIPVPPLAVLRQPDNLSPPPTAGTENFYNPYADVAPPLFSPPVSSSDHHHHIYQHSQSVAPPADAAERDLPGVPSAARVSQTASLSPSMIQQQTRNSAMSPVSQVVMLSPSMTHQRAQIPSISSATMVPPRSPLLYDDSPRESLVYRLDPEPEHQSALAPLRQQVPVSVRALSEYGDDDPYAGDSYQDNGYPPHPRHV